ncbi:MULTISPECIES: hypothetical protein [Nostoc]|uniref:Uncharacterized protein n=1 Tax=Nostoc paludosum FACHB-159 TaxID=2692908 RepID=A0ABR8KIP1_9NOSO|nr:MULTISPECIES: hypothetical protein [Nostoc]MBD2681750.1 hypothetical protein [Nostoc sp. FACHB-857]MBD2738165.1 hypothetical protein [Nostoc paludosum FACHB-159]
MTVQAKPQTLNILEVADFPQIEARSLTVQLELILLFGTWLLPIHSPGTDHCDARILGYFTFFSGT